MKTKSTIKLNVLAICILAITTFTFSSKAQSRDELLSIDILKKTADAVMTKDSSHTYVWNSATSTYDNIWKNSYSYNGKGKISTIDYHLWDSKTKKWTAQWREEYKYDGLLQLETCEFLDYDVMTNQWSSSKRYNYTYNDENSLTCLIESWNLAASAYQNSRMESFSYSSTGQINEHEIQNWDAASNRWIGNSMCTKVYNSQGVLDYETSESWSKTTSNWLNLANEDHSYNDQNQKTQIIKSAWVTSAGSKWMPREKYTYSYSNNQVENVVLEKYSTATNNYNKTTKLNYTYNTNGVLTEEVNQVYNSTTSEWNNSLKQVSHWSKNTMATKREMTIGLYPNPTVSDLYVTGIESGATITIYDYSGRTIKIVAHYTNGIPVNVSDLSNGMYLIKANNQVSKFQKK